jgi:hypothetical protein
MLQDPALPACPLLPVLYASHQYGYSTVTYSRCAPVPFSRSPQRFCGSNAKSNAVDSVSGSAFDSHHPSLFGFSHLYHGLCGAFPSRNTSHGILRHAMKTRELKRCVRRSFEHDEYAYWLLKIQTWSLPPPSNALWPCLNASRGSSIPHHGDFCYSHGVYQAIPKLSQRHTPLQLHLCAQLPPVQLFVLTFMSSGSRVFALPLNSLGRGLKRCSRPFTVAR